MNHFFANSFILAQTFAEKAATKDSWIDPDFLLSPASLGVMGSVFALYRIWRKLAPILIEIVRVLRLFQAGDIAAFLREAIALIRVIQEKKILQIQPGTPTLPTNLPGQV